jgi:hypothetical protein
VKKPHRLTWDYESDVSLKFCHLYNFIVTLVPYEEEFPCMCEHGAWGRPGSEGGVGGGAHPNEDMI